MGLSDLLFGSILEQDEKETKLVGDRMQSTIVTSGICDKCVAVKTRILQFLQFPPKIVDITNVEKTRHNPIFKRYAVQCETPAELKIIKGEGPIRDRLKRK